MMFYDGVSSFILGNGHLVIFCIGPVWSRESKNASFLDKNPHVYRLCMGVSKNRGTPNGWFIMENPIKMDDLEVPLFSETSI